MNHRYNDRLRERLQEFAGSMSSISQIYFEILNAERRRVKLLPRWRQFIHKNKSKSTVFMEALARMTDLDIAKITEDALPASVHRVLTALMFSYLMSTARHDLTSAEQQ